MIETLDKDLVVCIGPTPKLCVSTCSLVYIIGGHVRSHFLTHARELILVQDHMAQSGGEL